MKKTTVFFLGIIVLIGFAGFSQVDTLSATSPSTVFVPLDESVLAVKNFNEGIQLYQRRNLNHALSKFEEAIKLKPDYLEAYYYISRIYIALEEWDKAIEACGKCLEINPNYEPARQNLWWVQLKKQSLPLLVVIAEKEVKDAPTPENYLNLSLHYYNNQQYEKCIEACYEAIKIKPDYSEAYNNICVAYIKMREYDKAIEACEKSLELNPDNELARNNLNWARTQKSSNQ